MPQNDLTRRADPLVFSGFRPRTSIRARVFRITVLAATFSILLLGAISFFVSTQFLDALLLEPGRIFVDPNIVGFTILIVTALLVAFAFLLSVLVSRQITHGIRELSAKALDIRTDRWIYPRTVQSGDEIESLDRIVANLTERLRVAYRGLEHRMQVTAEGLQRESALDSAILESIEYGVLVTDDKGVITEANPAAERLLLKNRSDIIGDSAESVVTLLMKNGEGEHPVRRAVGGGHVHSRPADHLRLVRHDQTFLPISLIAAPLFAEGREFGCVVVFQDMTEERQIDYMKSEFISLASHQLRTPLSSIRWYAELLTTGDHNCLSTEQQGYIQEIFTSSVRMANLIEALLHVARIESGVLVPEMKPVDVSEFVRQTCKEWDAMAREKQISLVVNVPSQSASVMTDMVLLQIILQNLLSNALKYSPKNTHVTMSLSVEEGKAVISVKDAGIGILPEDQERVFQKFFRGKNARTIDTDGNGLGLYISRSVAHVLGATFDFVSNPGQGSTFSISLPVATFTTK